MIVFDLRCGAGHGFEGWFQSGEAFAAQQAAGQLTCPACGASEVERVLSVPRIGNAGGGEWDRGAVLAKLAALQSAMLARSTWVGDAFATRARDMAEGTEAARSIHGRATPAEAKALVDDGVGVMPLLFPVVPPDQLN